MYVCMCVYIYIHTYTHKHTYTHTISKEFHLTESEKVYIILYTQGYTEQVRSHLNLGLSDSRAQVPTQ